MAGHQGAGKRGKAEVRRKAEAGGKAEARPKASPGPGAKRRKVRVAPALPPEVGEAVRGRIQIYTGSGKGKTTCAVGLCVRALGHGWRVALVQFDKGYDGTNEHYAERRTLRRLEGVELIPTGCERMNADGTFRFGAEEKDIVEARRGLDEAARVIREGRHRLVILDEVLSAVMVGLFGQEEVDSLLDLHAKTPVAELVLTGYSTWPGLLARADLVTEMRKVKHYYDAGLGARPGIEF